MSTTALTDQIGSTLEGIRRRVSVSFEFFPPADAAMVLALGAEAVFVGSGIFKSDDPDTRARAIVKATTYYQDPLKLLEASEDLGMGMPGLDVSKLQESELLQTRGW
jgi:pyridoxal 5'-phosphate synthase pdxS subunit